MQSILEVSLIKDDRSKCPAIKVCLRYELL